MLAPDLHNHSTYSILDGFGTPEAVAKRAKELGWSAAALTEHGSLGSAPTFYKACRAEGIKPIIGCELYVVPDEILGVKDKDVRSASFHLTVLALSAEGYHNLVAWNSLAARPENFYYKPRISLQAMAEQAPYPLLHNVVMSGCLGSELVTMLAESGGNGISTGAAYVDALQSIFPNFFIEIQCHRIKKFEQPHFKAYMELLERERLLRKQLIRLARATRTPLVLTNDSHYQEPGQRKAHIAMKASAWRQRDDEHYTMSQEARVQEFIPDYAYFGNYMRSMEKIAATIEGGEEGLAHAIEIAQESDVRINPLDDFTYSIPFSGYDDPIRAIRRRCKSRLAGLVAAHGSGARERFEHELESMGDFAHYLLLMSDFLIHAKKTGILTNTRGSAANSILCYCLKIHDIDSIEYGLTFERFFNPARKKLPDIDIDVERDRFEDFMLFVKERMAELEGDGQVVQICAHGTLANRSSFRLIAETLGVPKEQQDEIAKLLPQMIDSGMVDEENDVYESLKADFPELYELAHGVFDSIRNVTQHACGWLFGTKDRPISEWVPLSLIASSQATVTQYNLKSLEEMGLVKGDFLRLRTLSVIQRTRKMLGQSALDINDIPLDDPETFQMMREGRTEGVFTLQGKETRRGVVECEVANVHDVITAFALHRPALTRVGGNKLYNNRRKGIQAVSYPHEIAENILGPTYGVPVFQEQILEIGYALGMDHLEVEEFLQAIKMAKGVGRGAKEAFAEIKPLFMEKAIQVVDSDDTAEALWEFVAGFSGYGFNKGHATSYGLLAVRAAYLKCHYPQQFFTALLDVYPEKSKYIAAARAEGMEFLPPSVNQSSAGFSLDRDTGRIRVGLSRIKGLGPVSVRTIVAGQPYASFDDFRERIPQRSVNAAQTMALDSIGAFSDLGIPGSRSDQNEFERLGFTLRKPVAFRKLKPKYTRARESDYWTHDGLERGVDPTEPRHSVSKMFWLPDLPLKKEKKTDQAMLELKASPYAQVKTWLLHAVDESGIPFQIMVNEDKPENVNVMKYLAAKCRGNVVCLDGFVRGPFLTDGPLGFRLFGVTGTRFHDDPQVFPIDETTRTHIVALSRR
jgi:DNA polymerase III subunit alpha